MSQKKLLLPCVIELGKSFKKQIFMDIQRVITYEQEKLSIQITKFVTHYLDYLNGKHFKTNDNKSESQEILNQIIDLDMRVYKILGHRQAVESQGAGFELYKLYVTLLVEYLGTLPSVQEVKDKQVKFVRFVFKGEKFRQHHTFLKKIFRCIDHMYFENDNVLKLDDMCWNVFYRKEFKDDYKHLNDGFLQNLKEALTIYKPQNEMIQQLSVYCQIVIKIQGSEITQDEKYFEDLQKKIKDLVTELYTKQYQAWKNEEIPTPEALARMYWYLEWQTNVINGSLKTLNLVPVKATKTKESEKEKNTRQENQEVQNGPIDVKKEVLGILYEKIIIQYRKTLLKTNNKHGLEVMLKHSYSPFNSNKDEDEVYLNSLQNLYKVYIRLDNKFDQIRDYFKNFIILRGKKIFQDQPIRFENVEAQNNFIESLFLLLEDSIRILIKCFNKDQIFRDTIQDAFENFVNDIIPNQDKQLPQLLVNYCETILPQKNDTKFESQINYVSHLFKYMADKDIFIKVYQVSLSNRLLMGNYDPTKENKVIALLSEISGKAAIEDLDNMITEIQATSHNEKFLSTSFAKDHISFDVNILLLKTSSWPTYIEYNYDALTPDILLAQHRFEETLDEFRHKNLTWANSISIAVLVFKTNQQYEISATVYQAQILYLYQYDNLPLSLTEIQSATNIEKRFLLRNLKSLEALGLLKDDDQGHFYFNEGFAQKDSDIKLPLLLGEEVAQKMQVDAQNMDNILEAAIVKLLKKQGTMQLKKILITLKEEYDNKNYEVTHEIIKPRLERLVKMEFIKRDDTKIEQFSYNAHL